MEVRPSRGRDRGPVDGLDPLPVGHQLLDGQAVDDEPTECPADRAGRLESEREDPDEVVARGRDLRGGRRFVAHP